MVKNDGWAPPPPPILLPTQFLHRSLCVAVYFYLVAYFCEKRPFYNYHLPIPPFIEEDKNLR